MKLEDLEIIGYGSRVTVYRLPPEVMSQYGKSVVRVPNDVNKDDQEVSELELLSIHLDDTFFPSPSVEEIEYEGEVRRLILCDEVSSPSTVKRPSKWTFMKHLDESLVEVDDKVSFLMNMRLFVDQCKSFYYNHSSLPDLVGRGNVIPFQTGVYLLDFNNAGFEREQFQEGSNIHVPVDDQGIPIFDLSLHFLYHMEKYLLSYTGNNFSTPSFNRLGYVKSGMQEESFRDLGIFVSRDDLGKDSFYGALRFQARREEVQRIMSAGSIIHD